MPAHRSTLVLSLLSWASLAAAGAAQPIELSAPRSICLEPTVSLSTAIASAYLDDDEHLDVVVGGIQATRVLLNEGDATFRILELSQGTEDIEVFDMNGDGLLDIVGAYRSSFYFWAGDGQGGFAPIAEFSLGFGAEAKFIAVADFNGDLAPDVLVGCPGTRTVAELLGDGSGGFTLIGNFTVLGEFAALVTGDFNDDDIVDMAVTRGSTIYVRFGDGTGLFPVKRSIAGSGVLTALLAADFDGDGHDDLAAVCRVCNEVRLLMGDGSGSFVIGAVYGVPSPWHRLAYGDVTNDGHADLLVSMSTGDMGILPGDGGGGFGPLSVFDGYTEIAIGDFDSDGRVDMVSTPRGNGGVALHLGDGAGHFPKSNYYPGRADSRMDIVDLDDDGRLDVIAVGSYSAARLFFGDGLGGIERFAEFVTPGQPTGVVATDFNGDGRADFIVSQYQSQFPGIEAYGGLGDGEFAVPVQTSLSGIPRGPATADFDDDGVVDVAYAASDAHELRTLLGRGDGTFATGSTSPSDVGPTRVICADLDSDGFEDAVVAHGSSISGPAMTVHRGDGIGGMSSFLHVARSRPVPFAHAADVDDDGDLDVLAVESDPLHGGQTGAIFGLVNDGEGGFAVAEVLSLQCRPIGVTTGDLDADGHLDLVVTNGGSEGVTVLVGDGAWGFGSARSFIVSSVTHAGLGDFDGDGLLDVVACTSSSSANLRILRNRTLDSLDAFPGNVNAAVGPVTNVLFVNGQRGEGPDRRLEVDKDAPFVLRMKSPPALESAAFAVFAWIGESKNWTITDLPNGYGRTVIPAPPNGGRPTRIWNNTGDPSFGMTRLPSTPAPSVVLRRNAGVGKRVTFTLQGIVEDPASLSGVYATTNAITIESR